MVLGHPVFLIMIKKKNLIGLITDGDLRRTLKKNKPEEWSTLNAKDIMTNDPILINENELALDALKLDGK